MKNRSYIAILFLLVFTAMLPVSLTAEENQEETSYRYDTGDNLFFFSAGPYLPLFVLAPNSDPFFRDITDNSYLGGNASMGFEAFLNHSISLGVELGYTFSYAKNGNLYTAVPLNGTISYYLLSGDLDIPLTLGAGIIYNSYDDRSYLSPLYLRPEIGMIWNFNDNWGLGFDLGYWFVPEIYFGANASETAISNSASMKLTLQYKQ